MNALEQMQEAAASAAHADLQAIKEQLEPYAHELSDLQQQKMELQKQLADVQDGINEMEDAILEIWGPAASMSSNAELKFANVTLKARNQISVKAINKDDAITWFQGNGYGDVLKYDIHYQTMSKIAREHLEQGQEIPGLKYTPFTTVKVTT